MAGGFSGASALLRAGCACAVLAGCGMKGASDGTAQDGEQGAGLAKSSTAAPAPVGALGDSASVASVTQAATATTPVVFVVRTGGTDGYCDDVVSSGKHADAIQACIDKANAAGGGTVLLLAGTYSTGTWPLTLKSNVTLAGVGHRGAKLSPATTADIIGTVQDNTTIRDLAFDGTKFGLGAARFVCQRLKSRTAT